MKKFDIILLRLSLIIFLLGAGAMGGTFIISILNIGSGESGARTAPRPEVVEVDSVTQKEERLQLGGMYRIAEDKEYFSARLFVVEDPQKSRMRSFKGYSSYKSQPVKNYLIFDAELLTQHWVFETNNQVILNQHNLSSDYQKAHYGSSKGKMVYAVLYEVVSKDSNGDGELDGDDKVSLLIAGVDGRDVKPILEDIDVIHSVDQYGKNRTMISYYNDGKSFMAILGDRGELLSTSELILQ